MTAGVGEGGIMETLLTLFSKELLDNPIAADADLGETMGGTPVEVLGVPVVALLKGTLQDAIAAASPRCEIEEREEFPLFPRRRALKEGSLFGWGQC